MTKLMIVLGSVREGRVGLPIAQWAKSKAEADGRFEIDWVDLKELALPFMDEPNHPRLKQYTKEHTRAWSARVAAADAFLFAFPEYNYSYGPVIKNALDYLFEEWARKPVGFINWGGTSSGTRAQTALRIVVTALGMISTRGSVEIGFPGKQIADGVFTPTEQQANVLKAQLDELVALSALRK